MALAAEGGGGSGHTQSSSSLAEARLCSRTAWGVVPRAAASTAAGCAPVNAASSSLGLVPPQAPHRKNPASFPALLYVQAGHSHPPRSYCILPRAAPDCPSRQDGRDDQDDNRYQSTATPGQSFVGVDCGEERAITCTRTYHATCSGVATGRAEVYPRPSTSYAAPERAASLASSSANARERAAAISSAKTAEA